ncbi:nucleoside hydrolase [Candidatus Neomarinimicrobiota bacterium]
MDNLNLNDKNEDYIMVVFRRAAILVLGFLLILGCSGSTNEKLRIILDTDANNELDDQHAIAYMLLNDKVFDVEGITVNATSNGGPVEEHHTEAERVVKLCGLYSRIKIYDGANGIYQDIVKELDNPEFDGHEAVDFIIERAHAAGDRKLILCPVGKLTNIALALAKDPTIAEKVRIVWLGANYPADGEYNLVNDTTAVNPVLESDAEVEIVTVRYGEDSGTSAVEVSVKEIKEMMAGKGPRISTPVIGRHGGEFTTFGDYSIELFTKFRGNPESRPLYDMAAVAILKNPSWAKSRSIPIPRLNGISWTDQPNHPKKVSLWEHFDRDGIIGDLYTVMEEHTPSQ